MVNVIYAHVEYGARVLAGFLFVRLATLQIRQFTGCGNKVLNLRDTLRQGRFVVELHIEHMPAHLGQVIPLGV